MSISIIKSLKSEMPEIDSGSTSSPIAPSKMEKVGKTLNNLKEEKKPLGFWHHYGLSLGLLKKPLSLEEALDQLCKKTQDLDPVSTKEVITNFVKENWGKLGLPSYFDNGHNRAFLTKKITRIFLDHDQKAEEKKEITQNVLGNFKTYLVESSILIESDIQIDKELRSALEIYPSHKIMNIEILGDETHNRGKTPLAVGLSLHGKKIDKKIVFKPRSMITESRLCGKTSSAFEAVGLHTYSVHDKGTHGYSAYLENIPKENTFDSTEDLEYYLNLFNLMDKVMCFFGISDLHQENVVTVKKQPHIIDTEVVAPNIDDAYNSGLVTGMTAGFLFAHDTPNRIYVSPTITPPLEFEEKLEGEFEAMRSLSLLRKMGVINVFTKTNYAKRPLTKEEIVILESIKKDLDTHFHRIILADTIELTMLIKQPPKTAFANFQHTLAKGLKSWKFSKEYSLEELEVRFNKDLKNNDVPVFYYKPITGEIYYHDLLIGKNK